MKIPVNMLIDMNMKICYSYYAKREDSGSILNVLVFLPEK